MSEPATQAYNVLLMGDNHSGKSSIGNTFGHELAEWDIPKLPAGRKGARGTNNLGRHMIECMKPIQYKRESCEPKILNFFDTAGRKFSVPLSEGDILLLKQLIAGMKVGTDLTSNKWIDAGTNPDNKIDHIILVVSAETICKKVTSTYTTGSKGWFSDTRKTHTKTSYEISIEEVKFIKELYNESMKRLGGAFYPIVCCTHMDKVPNDKVDDIKQALRLMVHETNVFFVSTWGLDRDIEKYRETFNLMALKIVMDVDQASK